MEEVSIVASRLKEARMRAGFSQKQLGIKAGIDQFSASARINQYERGKHTPDLQTLSKLAEVLDTPFPYFFCEDEELAELICKFSALTRVKKKKVLASLQD